MDPIQPQPPQPPQLPQPSSGQPNLAPSHGDTGVRWVLVRAAALGFLIVIAVIAMVWLVSIPLFSLGQPPINGGSVPPVTIQPDQSMTSPTITTTVLPSTTTDQLPKNSEVFVSIGPKTLAGRITVGLDGGPGKAMVKEISVRLTRPDGFVATGSMDMQAEFPEVTLQGSKSSDRVEVFVRLLSGKTYKVIDEMVSYRQRI